MSVQPSSPSLVLFHLFRYFHSGITYIPSGPRLSCQEWKIKPTFSKYFQLRENKTASNTIRPPAPLACRDSCPERKETVIRLSPLISDQCQIFWSESLHDPAHPFFLKVLSPEVTSSGFSHVCVTCAFITIYVLSQSEPHALIPLYRLIC